MGYPPKDLSRAQYHHRMAQPIARARGCDFCVGTTTGSIVISITIVISINIIT